MRILVLAALLAAASAQDAAEVQKRLQEVLAQRHPDLPLERRNEISTRFTQRILATKSAGHDPADVLVAVEWKLNQGTGLVEKIRTSAWALGSGLDRWVADAPATLVPPASLLTRERDANLAGIEAYLEEGPTRPAASEADKQALRTQFERVGEEIRSVARSRITGPYRDAVVEQAVKSVLEDQLGPDLGNPVVGAVTRPLSAAELQALLLSIAEEGARAAPVDASGKADEAYGRTGEFDASRSTPAIEFASKMANRLYQFGVLTYPRTSRALDERDAVVAEAMTWVQKAWEPISKDLERQRVEFKLPEMFARAARPKPPPVAVGPATAASLPPPTKSGATPAPASAPSGGRWVAGAVLLAVALAVGLYSVRRRSAPRR